MFRDLGEIPADFGPTALTIGNFDGVHRGHQAVLERIVTDARNRGQASVAVTFDPHPATVHRPSEAPRQITGLDERLRRLEATGLDAVLVQHYTLELAKQSAEEYVRSVFVDALHATTVVVGRDVRFGWQNSGDLDTLRELGRTYGFDVRVIDDIGALPEGTDNCAGSGAASEPGDGHGGRWSSSHIRDLLTAGDVAEAARMLGRAHIVSGTVVHGEARGRDLGFPTANIGPDAEGLIPADGVYAGWLVTEGRKHPAAISVGTNPTFDRVRRRVEAHVIDRHDAHVDDFDLYGKYVVVEFVARLRGMVAYRGMEPLIEQMTRDVVDTRAALGLPSAHGTSVN
nr:bifunctional riboflavin kinase/FAD synthetase [Spelaeicoccus albus]